MIRFLALFLCCLTASAQVVPFGFFASSTAAYDSDAQDFFTRVELTGATITTSNKTAVNNLVVSGKANGWWTNVLDLGVFMGNTLTGAMVKLKSPAFAFSALAPTNMNATNLVLGGISSGSGKSMGTGVNITNIGPFAGLSVFLQDEFQASPSASVLGGNSGTDFCSIRTATGGSVEGYWGGVQKADLAMGSISKGFYHVFRPTTTVLALWINGRYSGSTNTTSVAMNTANNAALQVLNGSTNTIALYAIDNGTNWTLTTLAAFAADMQAFVRQSGRMSTTNLLHNFVPSFGQSLAIGSGGGSALSTTTLFKSRQPTRGPLAVNGIAVQANFPLLHEFGSETHCSGFANEVAGLSRTNGFGESNDVTAVTFGQSGAPISLFTNGTAVYLSSLASISNAFLQSPDYFSGGFRVPSILMIHGESDQNSITYSNELRLFQSNWNADIKMVTGQTNNIPLLISQMACNTATTAIGGTRPTNTVDYQMLSVFEAYPTNIVMVCPKYFLPHVSDGIHLTNSTYRWLGEYYAKAYYRQVIQGQQWLPLYPTNISRVGANIDLVFPTTNDLAWDTTLVTTNANFGFEYFDSGGSPPTISSVTFLAGTPTNTVRVTLTGSPTGTAFIRYAYTGTNTSGTGSGCNPINGPRGNLKRPETFFVSQNTNNLDDWCLHFNKLVP